MTKATGLSSDYPLNEDKIDEKVAEKKIGVYCLGYRDEDNDFIPKYVGRSDGTLRKRLKDWVGKYKRFKFKYYTTVKGAFEKECDIYHDWKKQLDNKIHPDRPEGKNWQCPRCDIFKE